LQGTDGRALVFYTEYLDLVRFADPQSQVGRVNYLESKYAKHQPDLIIVVGSLAYQFLENNRDLFSRVPVMVASVNIRSIKQNQARSVVGVLVKRELRDTLDLALKLQPDTTQVVLPVGSSAVEQNWMREMQRTLQSYRERVTMTFLTRLSMDQTLKYVENLPPHTIVLYGSPFFFDAAGRYFVPEEALVLICQHANAPVYAQTESDLGTGIVGGHLYRLGEVGTAAGRLSSRILAGEAPEEIGFQVLDTSRDMFDARQLYRWRIDEARLPSDSIVEFKRQSAWELYRDYIITGITVLFLETLLVFALLWQRRMKRRVEQSLIASQRALTDSLTDLKKARDVLSESEQRFRLVANTAPVLIWMAGTDRSCTYFNQPWLEFTGRPLAAELGSGWIEGVYKQDVAECLRIYHGACDVRIPFEMECRLRRHDGKYRWILNSGVPRFGPDGSFAGYIGSAVDITDRKTAEQLLATAQTKLIEAQEEERRRIASELHDDINQRMAMLANEICDAAESCPDASEQLRFRHLQEQTQAISSDIQQLSHQLHPSVLQHLVSRLSWKWKMRSSGKITERTYAKRAQELYG
jgi:PAS domain S-box-containing protein